jgi:multicomponent Na+:H+ antiporter subunit C
MSSAQMYSLCGVALFSMGLWGVVVLQHLFRKIIGLNIMGAGVFLVLVAMGNRTSTLQPDPVPHAMVLTGIVVAISATALALSLLRRLYRETGLTTLPQRGAGPHGNDTD